MLHPTYTPTTVNTDGWAATQVAWRTLFPTVVTLLCFLYAFLRIRERCQRMPTVAQDIATRVWDVYHAATPEVFRERVATLWTWAQDTLSGPVLGAVAQLVAKEAAFLVAYDHPGAYRTSNLVDRLIDPLDRWLIRTHGLHGHWASAERSIRAWALMQNFLPYCPRAEIRKQYQSPMHQLNGFVYHDNWLHNLLIASSCSGMKTAHRIR